MVHNVTRATRMKPKLFVGGLIVTALGWGALNGSAFGLDLSSLSNADASAGLKQALDQGINLAVAKLGVTDGVLMNPKVMMAEEEHAIRKDPLGQTNNLLKKVFGALR